MSLFPVLIVGCTWCEEQMLRRALQGCAPRAEMLVARTGVLAIDYLTVTNGDEVHSPRVLVLVLNSFWGAGLEVLNWVEGRPQHSCGNVIGVVEQFCGINLDRVVRTGLVSMLITNPGDWSIVARGIAKYLPKSSVGD
jgi:hypothetical protein